MDQQECTIENMDTKKCHAYNNGECMNGVVCKDSRYPTAKKYRDKAEADQMKEYNNQSLNLEILAEECAEIQQAKSKIIRFGIDDYHPKNGLPNREKLENEIGHLLFVIDILVHHGTITQDGIMLGMEHKKNKMKKWYRELAK